MVVVLVVVGSLSGLKEEVARHHLEDSACEGPDVGRSVVVGSDDDFW